MKTKTMVLQMYTPEQVAELVGIGVRTVRDGELRHKLPWVKVGTRSLRVPRSAVEKLLAGELG